jgi:hypothetical protein
MPINVNGTEINSTIVKTLSYKDIPTDNLLIHLDASANDSYPGSGAIWYDITGNGYDATLNNSVGYTSNGGGMMTFNGSNQTAVINVNSFARNNVAYTFSTFFYLTTSNGAAPFCMMTTPNDTNNNDGFWQHLNLGNWLWRTEDSSGEFGGNAESPSTFVGGNYYHIVVVVKTNQLLFYRNGTLLSTISTTFSWANVRNDNTMYLFIGKGYEDDYYLSGNIGNFQLYNKQLSATEISSIYNTQKSRFGL